MPSTAARPLTSVRAVQLGVRAPTRCKHVPRCARCLQDLGLGSLSAVEQANVKAMTPELIGSIQKGVEFAQKQAAAGK